MVMEHLLFEEGLGIWGNETGLQCGVCCYELNNLFFGKECKNFGIEDGRAFCRVHKSEEGRHIDCKTYFCGNLSDFNRLERESRKKAREIAEELGTVPKAWEELKERGYQTYLALFAAKRKKEVVV